MVHRCAAYGCRNRMEKKQQNVHYFRFPIKNPALVAKWIAAMDRKNWTPSIWARLCSLHFIPALDYQLRPGTDRPLLKPDAIPSVFNVNEEYMEQLQRKEAEQARRKLSEKEYFATILQTVEGKHKVDDVTNETEANTRDMQRRLMELEDKLTDVEKNIVDGRKWMLDMELHIRMREAAVEERGKIMEERKRQITLDEEEEARKRKMRKKPVISDAEVNLIRCQQRIEEAEDEFWHSQMDILELNFEDRVQRVEAKRRKLNTLKESLERRKAAMIKFKGVDYIREVTL